MSMSAVSSGKGKSAGSKSPLSYRGLRGVWYSPRSNVGIAGVASSVEGRERGAGVYFAVGVIIRRGRAVVDGLERAADVGGRGTGDAAGAGDSKPCCEREEDTSEEGVPGGAAVDWLMGIPFTLLSTQCSPRPSVWVHRCMRRQIWQVR